MKTLANILLGFMLFIIFPKPIFAQEDSLSKQIWLSIGGQDKWNSLQYLAFSAKGNSVSEQLSNEERKFLFNRSTGECRFDGYSGPDQVTYLFNFKGGTNGADKLFIDGSLTTDNQELKQSIKNQLFTDLHLLLLPTLIEQKSIQLKNQDEQFVGGQKLTVASMTSSGLVFGTKLDGLLYIDQNTGEIIRYDYSDKIEKISYEVSKYKEIGDGIRLPSSFIAANNEKRTCIFSSISSFLQVEQKKFKEL